MGEIDIVKGILIGKSDEITRTTEPLVTNGQFTIPPFFLGPKERNNTVDQKIVSANIEENQNKIRTEDIVKLVSQNGAMTFPQFFDLRIKAPSETEFWTFPIEPLISIRSRKILIKRRVAKQDNGDKNARGSIKEVWTNDDYDITISGVFIANKKGEYPRSDMMKLRNYLELNQTLNVLCPLFEIFNIGNIVVEDWDLPFTKGKENQNFIIKAVSDDPRSLILKKR